MNIWSCTKSDLIWHHNLVNKQLQYIYCSVSHEIKVNRQWNLVMMMMMMMMMNCICGMVDRRKAFSLISSRDHCQRSSPSRISNTPRAGFEPAENLSLGFIEWSCSVVITQNVVETITRLFSTKIKTEHISGSILL